MPLNFKFKSKILLNKTYNSPKSYVKSPKKKKEMR